MGTLFRLNCNLEMLVFEERGKLGYQRKTSGSRIRSNNNLKPHLMPRLGIEPGPHWWVVSALTTAVSQGAGVGRLCFQPFKCGEGKLTSLWAISLVTKIYDCSGLKCIFLFKIF